MQTELKIFHGPNAKALYWQIFDWDLVSLPSHAVDLGCELQKAEIALRVGIPYQQDRPLNFSPVLKERASVETDSISKEIANIKEKLEKRA